MQPPASSVDPAASSFELTGKRAVVTGAGGGLGRAMAEGLAHAGASVCLIGRGASVEQAATDMATARSQPSWVICDLADRADLRRGFADAVRWLDGIDILVTSHGTAIVQEAATYTLDAWDQTLEVNLTSVMELCQLAAEHMLPSQRGKIINIASMLSFFGGARVAAYAASKGGVAQLTKALANEWAPHGVNVNAIAPGYVKTRLNRHIWDDPAGHESILRRLPAGRWGEPDDLKGPVVFLASAAADYLHGVILPVDGGYLAR
jgi:2-dehydro-3-deoxy-D-gluconate 5-dehydrogenase